MNNCLVKYSQSLFLEKLNNNKVYYLHSTIDLWNTGLKSFISLREVTSTKACHFFQIKQ